MSSEYPWITIGTKKTFNFVTKYNNDFCYFSHIFQYVNTESFFYPIIDTLQAPQTIVVSGGVPMGQVYMSGSNPPPASGYPVSSDPYNQNNR